MQLSLSHSNGLKYILVHICNIPKWYGREFLFIHSSSRKQKRSSTKNKQKTQNMLHW